MNPLLFPWPVLPDHLPSDLCQRPVKADSASYRAYRSSSRESFSWLTPKWNSCLAFQTGVGIHSNGIIHPKLSKHFPKNIIVISPCPYLYTWGNGTNPVTCGVSRSDLGRKSSSPNSQSIVLSTGSCCLLHALFNDRKHSSEIRDMAPALGTSWGRIHSFGWNFKKSQEIQGGAEHTVGITHLSVQS